MQHVCTTCGATSPERLACCPRCVAFGTFAPVVEPPPAATFIQDEIVISARELRRRHVATLDLSPELTRITGRLPRSPAVIVIHGPPGSGKSCLALRLASAHAGIAAPALYVASEEGLGVTMSERLRREEIISDALYITASMDLRRIAATVERLGAGMLVIDSLSASYLGADDLARVARELDVLLVIVLQICKSGEPRGPMSVIHLADVVIRLEARGRFVREKSRYDAPAEGEWWS